MLDEIESQLAGRQWLSGSDKPNQEDGTAFAGLEGAVPNPDMHPNAFAWYAMISKWNPAKLGGSAPAKKVEAKEPAAADESAAAAEPAE